MKKRNVFISITLFIIMTLFTALVCFYDVKPLGINKTDIGFSSLNTYIFNELGTNYLWYKLSEVLGIVALILVFIYGAIGTIDLIKKKSIFKVDKKIILLGIFYIIVFGLYIIFDKVIINYRPILVEGVLESSYPSSHTLLSIFVFGSSLLINKYLFPVKKIKIVNCILFAMMILTVIGRLLSGMHWFTDIVGGILIASFLLYVFKICLNLINNKHK